MPLNQPQRRRLGQMVGDILEKHRNGQGEAQAELLEMIVMTQPDLKVMIKAFRVQLAGRIGTNQVDVQVRLDALQQQADEIAAEQQADP